MAEADEVLNADEFRSQLRVFSDAAIGVFAVRTREPFRALWELRRFAIEQSKDQGITGQHAFKVWTVLNGWQEYAPPSESGEDVLDWTQPVNSDNTVDLKSALKKLGSTEGGFGDGVYAIFGGDWMLEDPGLRQHIKNFTQHCLDNPKRLVFVLPEATTIPTTIEDDIQLLDFKTPSMGELRRTWNQEISVIDKAFVPNFEESDVNIILHAAAGMTQQEFANSLAVSLVELSGRLEDGSVAPGDFSRIILRNKVEIIKRTDILELLPEASIHEIGGLDLLKEWIGERAEAMTSEEARAFGIDAPKGVLVVGPPGGGKSMIAKAVASLMNVAGIKFDVGRVFGSLVGQSEQRTRKALSLIDAMAPVVVLVDEVDKGLGGMGGSGDSGVSQRVLGTILNWMQDRAIGGKPPVFLIFTANNVIGLPPELMRKGRLDEIFAVTFPEEVERAEILSIHLKKRGHQDDCDSAELRVLAKETKGFVGAELESLVSEGLIKLFNAQRKGSNKSMAEILLDLAKSTTPLSVAFADKVEAMNSWAKNNAKPASSGMSFEVEKTAVSQDGTKVRRLHRVGPVRPKTTTN